MQLWADALLTESFVAALPAQKFCSTGPVSPSQVREQVQAQTVFSLLLVLSSLSQPARAAPSRILIQIKTFFMTFPFDW